MRGLTYILHTQLYQYMKLHSNFQAAAMLKSEISSSTSKYSIV